MGQESHVVNTQSTNEEWASDYRSIINQCGVDIWLRGPNQPMMKSTPKKKQLCLEQRVRLLDDSKTKSQRELARAYGISLGTVNTIHVNMK